jgi:hypothetical protein
MNLIPINDRAKRFSGIAVARRRRIAVRPGYARTHEKPTIRRRLDRSVVFLDL